MEKKTDGKMNSVASIPDNYVSILQLQERWRKEKERKHKETDLGVKQQQQQQQHQVNGQRRREEVEEPRVNLVGGFHANPRKKKPNCDEKEEAEVSAVVVSKTKEKDGEYSREGKKKWSKNKKKKKKKKKVKEEIQGVKTVKNEENNNAASNSLALETQFQHLQIRQRVEEDRQVKVPAKSNSGQGHYRHQKHEIRTMVWVKKGENNAAGGGNGFNF